MDTHLEMQELADLGFELIKSYTHDNFVTQRRKKGVLQIETTWQMPSGKFENQDLTIDEVNSISFKKKELIKLDKILNKNII